MTWMLSGIFLGFILGRDQRILSTIFFTVLFALPVLVFKGIAKLIGRLRHRA